MNTKHIKICHSEEKLYQCPHCGMKFALNERLTNHLKTHTCEKPHSCQVCSKRFAIASQLKTHERVHTGDKPYKCSTCDSSFSQKGSLKNVLTTSSKIIYSVATIVLNYLCTLTEKVNWNINFKVDQMKFLLWPINFTK